MSLNPIRLIKFRRPTNVFSFNTFNKLNEISRICNEFRFLNIEPLIISIRLKLRSNIFNKFKPLNAFVSIRRILFLGRYNFFNDGFNVCGTYSNCELTLQLVINNVSIQSHPRGHGHDSRNKQSIHPL
ncbi:hypothetical protein DERP_004469 [Dermatophagoides pteronyssinus]|uniref:Uncharacterized protein n=1 Tax=Dermatophagoides pteronyssinus TaxID=6956 RepID=A0ABQ8JPD0_DERPT|nr:hypothetical protein DERP_004469 [Dermatophagoides pteronyssinus]